MAGAMASLSCRDQGGGRVAGAWSQAHLAETRASEMRFLGIPLLSPIRSPSTLPSVTSH